MVDDTEAGEPPFELVVASDEATKQRSDEATITQEYPLGIEQRGLVFILV